MSKTHWLVAQSENLYRLLLLGYPTEFRREYSHEMLQTFRDCSNAALQSGGISHLSRFWLTVIADFMKSVCVEYAFHLKNVFSPEKDLSMLNTPFQLKFAQLTDIGLKRANNEDNMLAILPDDTSTLQQKGALFVVADGMGGHTRGERASELAVNTIRDTYYQAPNTDILTNLEHAIQQANLTIYQENQTIPAPTNETSKGEMGTTIVAAILHNTTLHIANAGDSFAYLIHDGHISQLAEDHTWVSEQVRSGKMTEEEALKVHGRNVIYRSLGHATDLTVYQTTTEVASGDSIVLCTDGLHSLVSEDEIKHIVATHTPEESARQLVAHANASGGPDNITAIVINVAA